jgi:two-component system nitrate/nitrite response regulator NarL
VEQLIRGEAPRMEVGGMARNSEEALSSAQGLSPDVILLDADLGGSCSVDILPGLPANGVSKVLLLTGSSDQETLDLDIKRGARGILHKTAATAAVLKAIEKYTAANCSWTMLRWGGCKAI